MQNIKVGDRVRNRYNDSGTVLELYTKNGQEKAVVRIDDGHYGNYLCKRLQIIENEINVFAVCDENGRIAFVKLDNDSAITWIEINQPLTEHFTYSIRKAKLIWDEME